MSSEPSRSFVASVLCLALFLINISGCGTPAFTPAEQAEVDKYVAEYGRGALVYYLQDGVKNADENLVLKYVKYFVSQGADVNMNVDNMNIGPNSQIKVTALHMATARGYLNVVRFLVSKGANINVKDGEGNMPIHYAAYDGNLEVIEFLVSKGADVNAQGYYCTPLSYCLWLDEGNDDLALESEAAVIEAHTEAAKFLVSHGGDVNRKDDGGKTILHSAASKGKPSAVKFLVSHGANVNAKDRNKRSPLDYAIYEFADRGHPLSGHLEVIKFLVSKGADVSGVALDDTVPVEVRSIIRSGGRGTK